MTKNISESFTTAQNDTMRREAKARRRKGRRSFHVGQPLFEGIRQDREERRNRSAERRQQATQVKSERLAELIARINEHVRRSADLYKWSTTVRDLAFQYILSLCEEDGTGEAPKDLRGKPLEIVQQKFAMTVLTTHGIHALRLPGVSQDWYPERLESARAYRSRRNGRPNHATPAAG